MTNYTKEDGSTVSYETSFNIENVTSSFIESNHNCNSSLLLEQKGKTVWYCIHSNTSKCYLSPKVRYVYFVV